MQESRRTYLPAARWDWALPLYDPFVRLLGTDKIRRVLLDQVVVDPIHRLLDIGCGTGTLVTQIKRLYPDVDVVGLDPDPKALARGSKKAARAGVSIQFDQGFSDHLPYAEACFDRVFSGFMFHHPRVEEQERTMREVRRVLAPAGSFHMVDFAGWEAHAAGRLARRFHSSHGLKTTRLTEFSRL